VISIVVDDMKIGPNQGNSRKFIYGTQIYSGIHDEIGFGGLKHDLSVCLHSI